MDDDRPEVVRWFDTYWRELEQCELVSHPFIPGFASRVGLYVATPRLWVVLELIADFNDEVFAVVMACQPEDPSMADRLVLSGIQRSGDFPIDVDHLRLQIAASVADTRALCYAKLVETRDRMGRDPDAWETQLISAGTCLSEFPASMLQTGQSG